MKRFSNTLISLSVGFICKSASYSSKEHPNDDVERYRTAKHEILYEVFAFFYHHRLVYSDEGIPIECDHKMVGVGVR